MACTVNLNEKVCVPCSGDIPPLTRQEVETFLNELPSKWLINNSGHLYKAFLFPDFVKAMRFANQVADIAEMHNHHPNLEIAFGRCGVEIWTHKINGLAESDFVLAAKIDEIKI